MDQLQCIGFRSDKNQYDGSRKMTGRRTKTKRDALAAEIRHTDSETKPVQLADKAAISATLLTTSARSASNARNNNNREHTPKSTRQSESLVTTTEFSRQ